MVAGVVAASAEPLNEAIAATASTVPVTPRRSKLRQGETFSFLLLFLVPNWREERAARPPDDTWSPCGSPSIRSTASCSAIIDHAFAPSNDTLGSFAGRGSGRYAATAQRAASRIFIRTHALTQLGPSGCGENGAR
jgi:hypothetical protein